MKYFPQHKTVAALFLSDKPKIKVGVYAVGGEPRLCSSTHAISRRGIRLGVSLVTADGLVAITVAIDSGIQLVQQVRVVRTGRVLSGARASSCVAARCAEDATSVGTVSVATAVQVRVNSGIGLVGEVAVVWTGIGGVGDARVETGTVGARGTVCTSVVASVTV